MENKYYTPQIEEFRVGFEYEYNNGLEYKVCIFEASDYEDLAYNWEDCDFRVKYLDQQDIEECGFNYRPYIDKTSKEHKIFINSQVNVIWDNEENRITIFCKIKCQMIFRGIIKNKSELKQILKMLGIYGK